MAKKSFYAFVFLLICGTAFGQSKDQLISDLTHKSNRVWRLEQAGKVEFLGDSCSAGIQYNFIFKNSKVLKKACVNNHWQAKTLTWLIYYKAPDYIIKLSNNEEYQIQFVKKNNQVVLRLRKFDPKATNDTVDLYFDPS